MHAVCNSKVYVVLHVWPNYDTIRLNNCTTCFSPKAKKLGRARSTSRDVTSVRYRPEFGASREPSARSRPQWLCTPTRDWCRACEVALSLTGARSRCHLVVVSAGRAAVNDRRSGNANLYATWAIELCIIVSMETSAGAYAGNEATAL